MVNLLKWFPIFIYFFFPKTSSFKNKGEKGDSLQPDCPSFPSFCLGNYSLSLSLEFYLWLLIYSELFWFIVTFVRRLFNFVGFCVWNFYSQYLYICIFIWFIHRGGMFPFFFLSFCSWKYNCRLKELVPFLFSGSEKKIIYVFRDCTNINNGQGEAAVWGLLILLVPRLWHAKLPGEALPHLPRGGVSGKMEGDKGEEEGDWPVTRVMEGGKQGGNKRCWGREGCVFRG